jgi:hypothetical protein
VFFQLGMEKSAARVSAQLAKSVQGMLDILTKQQGGVTSVGTFFEEFFRLNESMEKFMNPDHLKQSMAGLDLSGDMITMTDEMKGIMSAHANWMQFLMKHVENGVPIDDLASWSPKRVTKFLRDHGVNPMPRPSDAIQRKLAQYLKKFCLACMETINSMPDDDQAAALGAEAMGTATEEDIATIAKMNSKIERPDFVVEAQIPPETKLSAFSQWKAIKCENAFERARYNYEQKFGNGLAVYGVWLIFERIAGTHQMILESPSKDYLLIVAAARDTDDEKCLAIRPIGVRDVNGLPLVQVEYTYGTKKEGMKAHEKMSAGLRQGTLMQSEDVTSEQMDILICLLRENYENLNKDDSAFTDLEKGIPKKWKFSVVRPVDASKRGGIVYCPSPCGKAASKVCSRCKTAAYCSPECQKLQWKSHKRECRPPIA